MEKRIVILLLPLLLSAILHLSFAQSNFWEQTSGPRSSYVTSLVIKSDETVFAGTERGILRSTDGGDNWEITTLSNVNVHAAVITPNGYVFAGVDGAAVFRSTDNGLSWESVNINTQVPTRSIISLACNSTGELVAATDAAQPGVYRSNDYGDHWTQVASAPWPCIVALNDSGDMFIGYRWGGTVGRSTDHGKTWVLMHPGDFWGITRLLVNSRGHIFLGTERYGILRSTDNGETWDSASIGLPFRPYDEIAAGCTIEDIAIASGDTLFAATHLGGVFRSINNGQTWMPTSLDSPVSILAAALRGTLFAGRASVYRSTDYGDHWSRLNVPSWQDLMITSLTVNRGDTLYAGSWGHGLFRSTDYGESWKEIFLISYRTKDPLGCVAVDARGDLFMPLSHDIGSQCYRSTDYGVHWVGLPIGLWSIPPVFDDKGNMFGVVPMWSWSTIGYSTDNGDSWTLAGSGLPEQNINSLVINAGGDLFVGTDIGDIYRSIDSGGVWTRVNNGLQVDAVENISITPAGYIFLAAPYGEERVIYGSFNGGDSWQRCYSVPTRIRVMVGDAAGNLFVATDTMGVYRNGIPVNGGLPTLSVNSLALDSRGYLFVGTGGWYGKIAAGVYRSVQPVTSIKELPTGVPAAFVLEHNYPNPFNAETQIRYELPYNCRVKLAVFNLLGREVKELVNESQTPGLHEASFKAGELPSGVYFYKLMAIGTDGQSYQLTKKLMLMK